MSRKTTEVVDWVVTGDIYYELPASSVRVGIRTRVKVIVTSLARAVEITLHNVVARK
jgi:hypothetical protein